MYRIPALIDLSVPLHSGMPVWPGDPEVEITPVATVAADGYNLLALRLGSQSGTHVEAPFHVDDALPALSDLPLERFTGPAVVADLRGRPPRSPITAADLTPVAARIGPGVVLLLATDWSRHWGLPEYLAHPWLHPDAARLIVARGVRAVGIDAPSVDPSDGPPGAADPLPAHRVLAHAGAVIAENLTNLATLLRPPATQRHVQVWLLPLSFARAEGSPTRAVAELRPRARP
jgi:arylformamidase